MAKKKTTKKKDTFQKIGKDIDKEIKKECCDEGYKKLPKCTCGGCGYFLGFIGAAVYYISTATGFWNGVWGAVKALFWPAALVFELLKYLGA
ncbi:hypothetical protein KY345_02710 [Candidatus Woesearchaeota archaeon]|nr:hypothetical protein [Candidatus Woesearchaeota archaeon]